MQKHPDWWYLDGDVRVIKWPDFKMEPGIVYMGFTGEMYDCWCILGNGCKDFFDDIMDYHDSLHGLIPGWWAHLRFNKEMKHRLKKIPEGYFDHLYYGKDKKVKPV